MEYSYDYNDLLKDLSSMEGVTTKANPPMIEIHNQLPKYFATFDTDNIFQVQWEKSPVNNEEDCFVISFQTDYEVEPGDTGASEGEIDLDYLIVTKDDFVFNVRQDGILEIEDMIELCSVQEFLEYVDEYIKNPMVGNNDEERIGGYFFFYYLIKSALAVGINLHEWLDKINAAVEHLPIKKTIDEWLWEGENNFEINEN